MSTKNYDRTVLTQEQYDLLLKQGYIVVGDGRMLFKNQVGDGNVLSFAALFDVLGHIEVETLQRAVTISLKAKWDKQRIFFIGNGGSAAIASHMAADWLKNGGVAAMCFNDSALTTCLANDLGYEHVFAKPLSYHGAPGDLLFAISSSGKSRSITNAVEVATAAKMKVITLSGFSLDNPLRQMGIVNFHIPSDRYGVVEVAHHAICHAILDAVIDAGK